MILYSLFVNSLLTCLSVCLYRLENRLSCSARSGAARMIAGALVSVGPSA